MEKAIQWFPGHMTKAMRKIKEQLGIIDLIVFVLDARLPHLSLSPMLEEMAKGKKTILVLNKSDLAQPNELNGWQRHYQSIGYTCFATSAASNSVAPMRKYFSAYRDELLQTKKHRIFRPLRVIVLGIPNVGKSSIINKLVMSKSARTANKPGVTKGNQWLRIIDGIELLDTPGVLMPKIQKRQDGLLLALTGAIRDGIIDEETLLLDVIKPFLDHCNHPSLTAFKKRYLIGVQSIQDGHDFLHAFASRGGLVVAGEQINHRNAAQRCITEYRKGLWGKLTLEVMTKEGIADIFSSHYWGNQEEA